MLKTSRAMSSPGVPFGMMKNDAALCGGLSGLVTAIIRMKSALDAFEANHLCPLITYSSPSRSARVVIIVGSLPEKCGSVSEKHDVMSPRRSGSSHCFFCSGVAPIAMQLAVAGVGRLVAEDLGAWRATPEDLVHQRQLHLAVALAPELGVEVARPQPAILAPAASAAPSPASTRSSRHVVVEERERLDLLVDEAAHPVQLRLELGVGREVPCHDGSVVRGSPVVRRARQEGRSRRSCNLASHSSNMSSVSTQSPKPAWRILTVLSSAGSGRARPSAPNRMSA